jgi:thiamine monophosphate synthase
MNKADYKYYVFLETINDLIKINLLKFNNINIIINTDQKNIKINENETAIIKFAKRNKIPFLFKNNIKKCVRYNANGLFIESSNKRVAKPNLVKKNFIIIGGVHNHLEYSQKLNLGCNILMLSPIFYNKKYSKNSILGITKFNLFSLNWHREIIALGGICKNNINKLKSTDSIGCGFKSLINEV